VKAWITQLLDPQFLALMAAADLDGQAGTASQVDVRLSSSNGKVRFRPAIVMNGGQQAMVEPLALLSALRSTG